MTRKKLIVVAICIVMPSLMACRSGLQPTQFTNTAFNFSFVQRIAVMPFESLSDDNEAGVRITRLMITELLASGTVEVVEPGEVRAALSKFPGSRAGRAPSLSTEEVVTLGRELGAQALILGAVTQSSVMRTAGVSTPIVSVDAHMVETETGETVWAATHNVTGRSWGSRVLGTGGKSLSETSRRCVQGLLETLID